MRFLLIILLCSWNTFAQNTTKIHFGDFVECFYQKTEVNPILIYDTMNGEVVDSLGSIGDKHTWYKIAIIESDYGWFKIKNTQRLPNGYKDFDYENYWVKSIGFQIMINHDDKNHITYLYDAPSKASNKIHRVDRFQLANVIETNDLWVKVCFYLEKKQVQGWLSFENQCAYPWVSGIKNE